MKSGTDKTQENRSDKVPVQRNANMSPSFNSAFTPMRLFDDLFRGLLPNFEGNNQFLVVPRVDVEDRDDEYCLTVDIPGVPQENIEIEITDNQLSVRAERDLAKEGKRRSTRVYGAFERIFMLPPNTDAEKIEAEYENGVLTIHIPRTEQAKPRRIEIGEKAQSSQQASH